MVTFDSTTKRMRFFFNNLLSFCENIIQNTCCLFMLKKKQKYFLLFRSKRRIRKIDFLSCSAYYPIHKPVRSIFVRKFFFFNQNWVYFRLQLVYEEVYVSNDIYVRLFNIFLWKIFETY